MVKKSRLREMFSVYKNNIHDELSASKFEPLSSDYNSLDGLNIHAALVDELHAHKTRDLYDVLDTGTGARRQPLMISITTAGHDKHSICREQHDYTEKVLDGLIDDDSFWGIIYCIDEEDKDDWQNEKIWIKANPNLNVSVKLRDLQDKAKKAAEVATRQNAFLQKHLNIWTESSTRWITADKWDDCSFPVDPEELKGRTCYGGLDLSSTTDTTALVLVFPPEEEGGRFEIIHRCWIPSDNMADRVRRDRVPYDVWARQGLIVATPGNIIDYLFVITQISKDAEDYDFRELAFDRWGSTMMIQNLQDMGFEEEKVKHSQRHLIQFGQGYASMNAPTKELEKMILSKEIAHGGNPVLAWMMANVVIKMDPAGNYKVDKAESVERVDGVVALVMAIDRAVRDTGESIYEERGVLTI
jgi:phage terminase large subunit-like protein